MDLRGLARELGFDVRSVCGLLSRFVEVTDKDLLSLERALAAGDLPAARSIAHHIKGAAAGLELREIVEAAAAVETGAVPPAAGAAAEAARLRAALEAVRTALGRPAF